MIVVEFGGHSNVKLDPLASAVPSRGNVMTIARALAAPRTTVRLFSELRTGTTPRIAIGTDKVCMLKENMVVGGYTPKWLPASGHVDAAAGSTWTVSWMLDVLQTHSS